MLYGLVTDQSRKSRAARAAFDAIRSKGRAVAAPETDKVLDFSVKSGFRVPVEERSRILKLRLHDEHMSPYFKTNMNLFHLLMMDEKTEIYIYQAEIGILFVFEGLPNNPQPFGVSGHDMR